MQACTYTYIHRMIMARWQYQKAKARCSALGNIVKGPCSAKHNYLLLSKYAGSRYTSQMIAMQWSVPILSAGVVARDNSIESFYNYWEALSGQQAGESHIKAVQESLVVSL